MSQEKKDSSAVTVSLLNATIAEFDAWRLSQAYKPSRSKVLQEIMNEFLEIKRQEALDAIEPSREALKSSGTTTDDKKAKTKATNAVTA